MEILIGAAITSAIVFGITFAIVRMRERNPATSCTPSRAEMIQKQPDVKALENQLNALGRSHLNLRREVEKINAVDPAGDVFTEAVKQKRERTTRHKSR
jgi:hypothetical protein